MLITYLDVFFSNKIRTFHWYMKRNKKNVQNTASQSENEMKENTTIEIIKHPKKIYDFHLLGCLFFTVWSLVSLYKRETFFKSIYNSTGLVQHNNSHAWTKYQKEERGSGIYEKNAKIDSYRLSLPWRDFDRFYVWYFCLGLSVTYILTSICCTSINTACWSIFKFIL